MTDMTTELIDQHTYLDSLGPIDYIVVEFPAGASTFTGEMSEALLRPTRFGRHIGAGVARPSPSPGAGCAGATCSLAALSSEPGAACFIPTGG